MNKKKIIILSISLLLVLSLLFVFIYHPFSKEHQENKKGTGIISVEENLDNEIYKPKPIELELMNDQEKEEVNLNPAAYGRIQVIERNEDGSIAAYRIINSDEDVLTEY